MFEEDKIIERLQKKKKNTNKNFKKLNESMPINVYFVLVDIYGISYSNAIECIICKGNHLDEELPPHEESNTTQFLAFNFFFSLFNSFSCTFLCT